MFKIQKRGNMRSPFRGRNAQITVFIIMGRVKKK